MNLFAGLEKFGIKTDKVDIYAEDKADAKKAEAGAAEAVEIPKEEDFLLEKVVRCQKSDNDGDLTEVKRGEAIRFVPDAGLRPRLQYVDSLKYDVASCPNCGYTSLNRYFEHITTGQIKLVKEQVCSNYQPERPQGLAIYDYDLAIDMHKLSLFNAMAKKARTSERAYNCLIISWLLRTKIEELDTSTEIGQQKLKDCKVEEEAFYKEAYEGFLKAVSTELFPICGMDQSTMDYLLANMAAHYKQYDVASKCISRVLTSSAANRKIKDKSLELKQQLIEEIKKNK